MLLLLLDNAADLEAAGHLLNALGGMPLIIAVLLLFMLAPAASIGLVMWFSWRNTKESNAASERRDDHYERIFKDQAGALLGLAQEMKELRESMEEGRRQRIEKDTQTTAVLQSILDGFKDVSRRLEELEDRVPAQRGRPRLSANGG